jgi:hypothetical protein
MTAKQLLDSFSETLMQDDRILSPRERELLTSILQNSRLTNSDAQTQSAVTAVIARSVGETIAQRAFSLVGGSVVDRILAHSGFSTGAEDSFSSTTIRAGTSPNVNPNPPAPQPPNAPKDVPVPPAPQPPNITQNIEATSALRAAIQGRTNGGVGVLEAPEVKRAQCVVLDEFLAPQELEELVQYTLAHEAEFQNSEVISPNGEAGTINHSHRRSRVLLDLGKYRDVVLDRVRHALPGVLDQFGLEEFPIARTEAQITASNDGDFFRAHSDDAQESVASRHITFVYFFHREPRQFEGGELLLHDSRGSSQTGSYQTIVPRQNQIVFFPCAVLHEISPVKCASRAFADSRFTLNGWLHK